MSATRPTDSEEFNRAHAAMREIRETIGDQLHDLVVEREGLGTYDELVKRVRRIGEIGRDISEAKGQQAQAEELGLGTATAVRREKDAMVMLRGAVMSLGEACGSWVVALDFDARRVELDARSRNGVRTRRRSDADDDI